MDKEFDWLPQWVHCAATIGGFALLFTGSCLSLVVSNLPAALWPVYTKISTVELMLLGALVVVLPILCIGYLLVVNHAHQVQMHTWTICTAFLWFGGFGSYATLPRMGMSVMEVGAIIGLLVTVGLLTGWRAVWMMLEARKLSAVSRPDNVVWLDRFRRKAKERKVAA